MISCDHRKDADKFWSSFLFSDETKLDCFSFMDVSFVWCRKEKGFTPINTVPIVKHGDRTIMLA